MTSEEGIENYVFDIYVDKNKKVWLIDFNVWHVQTNPLLFEWDKLEALLQEQQQQQNAGIEFRVADTKLQVKPNPLTSYRAPINTVDLAAGVGSFQASMDQCVRPSELEE